MKNILILFLIGISNISFSQTMTEIDSVSFVMCEYLKQSDIKNDGAQLQALVEKQLIPYLKKGEQSKAEKVGQQVYYRLQRNCVEFRNLLDRLEPPKEKVVRITEKPKSEISKRQLKEFKKQKEFYYFEVLGDTTTVLMDNGFWTDSFTDKTFSNLSYKWISKKEFELVFIKSDNETRSNFSVKGDKFVYQVLAQEENYYLLSVNIPGQKVFEKIKLYYK